MGSGITSITQQPTLQAFYSNRGSLMSFTDRRGWVGEEDLHRGNRRAFHFAALGLILRFAVLKRLMTSIKFI